MVRATGFILRLVSDKHEVAGSTPVSPTNTFFAE